MYMYYDIVAMPVTAVPSTLANNNLKTEAARLSLWPQHDFYILHYSKLSYMPDLESSAVIYGRATALILPDLATVPGSTEHANCE